MLQRHSRIGGNLANWKLNLIKYRDIHVKDGGSWSYEEEGVEPGDDGEDPHGPDEQLRPGRHDGGDLG